MAIALLSTTAGRAQGISGTAAGATAAEAVAPAESHDPIEGVVDEAAALDAEATHDEEGELDLKKVIFEHLGDRYGWEVPFDHSRTIHLPVIVWGKSGLHIFSSKRVLPVHEGHELVYPEWKDGDTTFRIAQDGPYKGKVVEVIDGNEYKPWDVSITKNTLAIFISVILVLALVLSVRRFHKRNGMKAPARVWEP